MKGGLGIEESMTVECKFDVVKKAILKTDWPQKLHGDIIPYYFKIIVLG